MFGTCSTHTLSVARTTRPLLVACAILLTSLVHAQLTVNSQSDLHALAQSITGPGVVIANPQITCHNQGYGEFHYTGSLLGVDQGVILTSGRITDAIGPNNVENTTFQQGTNGDPILNTVTGRSTKDACKFEFDIIPAGDSLSFDFVFASEEYNEWVGSQYNDVFGFFISGPGITGDAGIGNDHNIALIPSTSQAVTINNVNNGSHSNYYHDNAGGQDIQYDGFTVGLKARSAVQPCTTYHLKLIVADATDRKFDSGVFIDQVKSNTITMQSLTASGGPDMIEGCNNGWVRFTRQRVTAQPLLLQYYLQGTATNGTDYTQIGNPSPLVPKTITIPANQAYVDQPVVPLADAIDESTEYLRFILGNPNCPGTPLDTLDFAILDTLNASFPPTTTTICRGDSAHFQVNGGQVWSWTPAAGLSDPNSASPWAHPNATTTYTVQVNEGSCSRTFSRVLRVSNIGLSAAITDPLCQGGTNGVLNLTVSGAVAPITYSWTGPNGFTASSEDLSGIASGTYTVTVQDAACSKTQSFNVGQPQALGITLDPTTWIFGQNIRCHGGSDGVIDATITGGTSPYTVAWTGPNSYTSSLTDINGLRAGVYNVNVTDNHGCTTSGTTTLTESPALAANISGVTNMACYGDNNGSATANVSGGSAPYTYSWSTSPAQTNATATGLTPGNYTVNVQDVFGCPISASTTITGPTQALTTSLAAKTDVRCFGNTTGSASITASGGTAPYTYSWNSSPVQNTAAATNLPAGTYTVTVTDANNCTTQRTVTIAQPAQALAVSASVTNDVACFGNTSGSATSSASGGTGPYAYQWSTSPVQNTANANNLPVGTYTVTARDVNNCTAQATVTVTGPAAALSASVTAHTDAACNGALNGSATVTANGGTAPYAYSWNSSPVQTSATATGLGAGNYTVTITDNKGCSTTASTTIAQPAVLAISGNITPALCQGAGNGAIDASVTGGTAPYTYSWSGPASFSASAQDISGLVAGGYTVVVTDAHGCSASQSFDVNQPGLFTVSAVLSDHHGVQVSCPTSTDGAVDVTVSGATTPYSYSWTGPGSFSASTQDISGVAVGSYSITITDANGCSTGRTYDLISSTPMAAQLTASSYTGGTGIACAGGSNGSITSALSGGVAPYGSSWNGPGGFTSAQQNISGLSAGTYTLVFTDANGCSATQNATLTAPAPINITTSGTVAQSCYGSTNGQATVSVTGGTAPYTYNWNTSPAQHAATATGLSAGTWTVTVIDANGCSATHNVVITGPAAPLTLSTTSSTNNTCFGGHTGAATVQAAGGTAPYAYSWNTSPTISSATATGLAAGSWTVQATDANGCQASRTVAITQPASALNAQVLSTTGISCYGLSDGGATLNITGGSGAYSVSWNTTPALNGSTISGVAAGTYNATITDNNGCPTPFVLPVTIAGPIAPVAVTSTQATYAGGANVSCPGATNGSIDATVTGGTTPYTYTWTDDFGHTWHVQDLTALAAGHYHLVVLDAHGCSATKDVTLTAPTAIQTSTATVPAICHGDNTGSVDLTATGGAPSYSYAWSGPGGYTASTADINHLFAGVYTVVVTDANGCTATNLFDVTEPGTFNFSATLSSYAGGVNVRCATSTDGSIDMTPAGGTPPYGYQWTGPNGNAGTTQDLSNIGAGTYHLVLMDANGCSALSTQTLVAPTAMSVQLDAQLLGGGYQVNCNGGNDGAIDATNGGGTPAYNYAWNGPNGFTANAADISALAAGTYALTITDANGCSVSASTTLTAPPAVQASIAAKSYPSGSGVSCVGANDGGLHLSATGGRAPYTVAWTGPNGFNSTLWDISGLQAGSYTATVTDANGCSATVNATVSAPTPIVLGSTVPQTNGFAIACFSGNTGSIDVNVSGGAGNYSYQWSGPNAFTATTQDLSGLVEGTYSLVLHDGNGCVATQDVTLTAPTEISVQGNVTTTACQGSSTGAVDITVGGGVGPYSYHWSALPAFNATTEDISALPASVYTVVVTDANGCTSSTPFDVGQPGMFNIIADVSTFTGGFNVSCAGTADGAIDATVTGGTPAYNYVWSDASGIIATSEDISGLAPGEYTLSLTDANGCGGFASFTLTAPTPLATGLSAATFPGGNNTGCDGSADGSIDASISGGLAPYTIAWTGPDGALGASEDLSGLTAGTYTLDVTDAAGCTTSNSITLTAPQGLALDAQAAVNANGTNTSCNGSTDGSITLAITGGTAPFHILWNGPNNFIANTADITGIGAGTYTVDVQDANGCSASASVQLTAPPAIGLTMTTSLYSGGNKVSCAGSSDGFIDASASGGTPAYTYAWNGPSGFTSSDAYLHDLAAGTYVLTLTDGSGCALDTSITLTQPLPLAVASTLSDAGHGYQVGCTGGDGSIDLTVSGGQPTYVFDWTGPEGFASQAEDISGLDVGTYTVLVTDINNCSFTTTLTLSGAEALTTAVAVTSNECDDAQNGAIDLTVSGGVQPYSFAWSNGAGTEDVSALPSGAYTVQVTDDAGCIATASGTIIAAAPIHTTLYASTYGHVNIACQGDSTGVIELGVEGGFQPLDIAWTGPNGFTSNATMLGGLPAGMYAVTITDAHGCTVDSSLTLVEPVAPLSVALSAAIFPSGTNVACFNGSNGNVDATTTGGEAPYTYAWRGPDSTAYATEDLLNIGAGTYELVVTDTNQCITTAQITLTMPDSALATALNANSYTGGFNVTCDGSTDGAMSVAVSGGSPAYTIAWSGPNGFTSSNDSISALSAGQYVLAVTDANSCVRNDTITLTAPAPVLPTLTPVSYAGGVNIRCANGADGSIAAGITGGVAGYALNWSGPNSFSSSNATITGLEAGTYCLAVTDTNGCAAQACVTLTGPSALNAQASATSASCGTSNGAVDGSVNGGTAPYALAWDNGAQTEDLANVPAGTYVLSVTDANGCTASAQAQVSGSPAVDAAGTVHSPLCHDAAGGAIDLTVSAGTAPYTFIWSNGAQTEDLSGLPSGAYSVHVTDANGCSWQDLFQVTAPEAITLDTTLSHYPSGYPISAYLAHDGSIAVDASGGTAPFSYVWSNGANTAEVEGLPAGTYTVIVTDANGCSQQLAITLDQPLDVGMPTGFTPNGDGQNDAYIVHGLEAYPTNELIVFNRWGNIVFQQINYHNTWRGENTSGQELPNGTYFVILRLDPSGTTLQNYVDLRR